MSIDEVHIDLGSERQRLARLAYRMLGGWADAEDTAQDALMRLSAQRPPPRNPHGWLTTVTTRIAIDKLRKAKARRETYPGPWLPDPIVTGEPESGPDLSVGMMLMLERLTPEERAAFTLREAFGAPYSEIAAALEKSEPAIRQLVSRARDKVRSERPVQRASPARHAELMQAFLTSVLAGDTDAIKSALRADVVLLTDGGGRRSAALRPIYGRDAVAGLIHFLGSKRGAVRTANMLRLNGALAFFFVDGEGDPVTVQIDAGDDGIAAIYTVRNPEKLGHLPTLADAAARNEFEAQFHELATHSMEDRLSPDAEEAFKHL
jgi:RNA polymerase sigma-70 factor (ECF subfamily)